MQVVLWSQFKQSCSVTEVLNTGYTFESPGGDFTMYSASTFKQLNQRTLEAWPRLVNISSFIF